MSFLELKKRRAAEAARKQAESEAADKAARRKAESEAAERAAEKAAPPAVLEQVVPAAPAPQLPQVAGPAGEAVALLPTGGSLLVVGLVPWSAPAIAPAVGARAKGLSVVLGKGIGDPKAFGKKVHPAAHLVEPDWHEKLEGQRFDAILTAEPLTHAPDPLAFLRQARALLKPEGTLVALVPNVAFGETRLALLQGEFPGAPDGSAALHHYTRKRLRELFALAGYRILEVRAHQEPVFRPTGDLTPELFPESLLQALGKEGDMDASHFAVKAVPATTEAILHELFDDQERTRKLARNELARAARTHDGLTHLLKEADAHRHKLAAELNEARTALSGMQESTQAAELSVRRLGDEADAATRELAAIKATWWYALMRRFLKRDDGPRFVTTTHEPGPWLYETEPEPKDQP